MRTKKLTSPDTKNSSKRKIRVIHTNLNLRNERFPHRKIVSDTEANRTALCESFDKVTIEPVDERLSVAWVS